MFSLFRRPPADATSCDERAITKVMPPGTVMHFLQTNYPEYMTPSGAIDAGKFPTAAHAASWAHGVAGHLFADATCQLLPDLEYARRWLE